MAVCVSGERRYGGVRHQCASLAFLYRGGDLLIIRCLIWMLALSAGNLTMLI
jgi:hypothetical protein